LPKKIKEKSILALTSKIISLCEKRVIPLNRAEKDFLAKLEADFYLERKENPFNVMLTIKNNIFVASSGIDESNTGGFYCLWPQNPQKTANRVRKFLKKKYKIEKIGVVITDSHLVPLRRGTIGVGIAFSGFKPLKDYTKEEDLFGRKFSFQKANLVDLIANIAVFLMGEGKEQTPMCIIEGLENIEFVDRNPTKKELKDLNINLKEDVFYPILNKIKWKRGKSGRYDFKALNLQLSLAKPLKK